MKPQEKELDCIRKNAEGSREGAGASNIARLTELELITNEIKTALEMLECYALERVDGQTVDVILYSVKNISRSVGELESVISSFSVKEVATAD